jgi:hypothetical protein
MLKGIVSISGQPGLFKLVAETKNRVIVESLATGKRMPASPSAKISALEDIAVFTEGGELPLKKILKKISEHEDGGVALDPKSSDDLIRKYFGVIVPDYIKEKVYVSDMKKIILWYNLLHEKEMLDFSAEEELSGSEEAAPESEEELSGSGEVASGSMDELSGSGEVTEETTSE